MQLDTSGWSGEGGLTQQLIEAMREVPQVLFLKVEDAPASRADAGFSFISNELFVGFASSRHPGWKRVLGVIPLPTMSREADMTLMDLEARLATVDGIGTPDYSDAGMLQFLRAERVIPAYQTRGYKLVEMVRIYAAPS